LSGHTDRVTSVAVLALDAKAPCLQGAAAAEGSGRKALLLASGSYDKEVRVWDLETGHLVADAARRPRCSPPLNLRRAHLLGGAASHDCAPACP
jgi:WD40 repeat protein